MSEFEYIPSSEFADAQRERVAALEAEAVRLRAALDIMRDALRFYEADHGDPHDTRPWAYDYERHRWYFTGPHPSDVADFALRKASLAEHGGGEPFEDYVGRAKRAALPGTDR